MDVIKGSALTKDKNSENVPYLQITEVVLVHSNIFNNNYQQDPRVLYTVALIKSSGQLLDISPKNFMVLKFFMQIFHMLKYGLLIKILNR